ncbi:MAG: hypothetical protein OXG46_05945 [Chloroflexi bacterium]|nr:hypothetical protein [Chloroflexota bacterium]MCY3937884.1 hypothetical protein [Chloroflexota bacterium]
MRNHIHPEQHVYSSHVAFRHSNTHKFNLVWETYIDKVSISLKQIGLTTATDTSDLHAADGNQ